MSHQACVVLHKALCAEYEAAVEAAFTKTVRKSCGQMDTEFQSVTSTAVGYAQWKGRVSEIYGSAEQSVSLWTLSPDDVEGLLQPIRLHGDKLIKHLVRMYLSLWILFLCFFYGNPSVFRARE